MIQKSARTYKIVTKQGLDHDSPPMKLYQKAKKLGVWNPLDIDFTKDKEDWKKLDALEKDYMYSIIAQFDAGEEAVSEDLLPLIAVVAKQGRLEEEMFLSTFLFEEIKHTEFFRRFIDEVTEHDVDLQDYLRPKYQSILFEELPKVMNRLWDDDSDEAVLDASITYNMVVEGVLAETGYHNFYTVLDQEKILPGLREGVSKIQRDESRHIGYGVYLIARIISAKPHLFDYVQKRMAELQQMSMEFIEEGAQRYDDAPRRPFGLDRGFGQEYAMTRFQGRMSVIMRAKEQGESMLNKADYELVGSIAGENA